MKLKENIVVLIAVAAFFASAVQAQVNKIKTHGFIAQGLIQASDSNFVNDDGDVSPALTEMGLNASYRISPKLRVAGQAVYLNGGNRYTEGVRLDYLFVDWEVINNFDWQLNFHLGRYKNYHWLYSATRDVPHTRPSIILPQSLYFDTFRDVSLGSDGVAMIARRDSELGELEVRWSYGTSPISSEQMQNLLSDQAKGDLEQDYDHQLTVVYRPAFSNMHFGVSLLDSEFEYTSEKVDSLVSGEATTQRFMLQFQYSGEKWDVSSELMRERVVFDGFLFPGFFNDATAEGGYLQGRYHINPDMTLLARVDLFDRDRKDRNGEEFERRTFGTVPGYFVYSDQATLGLEWDVSENWRLQIEYHKVKGTGRLAPVLSPNVEFNDSKYWDVWAFQLMYWF